MFSAALVEPDVAAGPVLERIAAMTGPIPLVQMAAADGRYRLDWLVEETALSTNTAAAGGNASLMAQV